MLSPEQLAELTDAASDMRARREFDEAIAYLQAASDRCGATEHTDRARIGLEIARAMADAGRNAAAEKEAARAREEAARAGEPGLAATASSLIAFIAAEEGRDADALRHALVAVEHPIDDVPERALAEGHVGQLLVASGRVAEGLAHFRQGIALLESIGDRDEQARFHLLVAVMEAESGAYDRAEHHSRRAVQLAEEIGDTEKLVFARLTAAEILMRSGETEAAVVSARAVVDSLAGYGLLETDTEATALQTLASTLLNNGLGGLAKGLAVLGGSPEELDEVIEVDALLARAQAILTRLGQLDEASEVETQREAARMFVGVADSLDALEERRQGYVRESRFDRVAALDLTSASVLAQYDEHRQAVVGLRSARDYFESHEEWEQLAATDEQLAQRLMSIADGEDDGQPDDEERLALVAEAVDVAVPVALRLDAGRFELGASDRRRSWMEWVSGRAMETAFEAAAAIDRVEVVAGLIAWSRSSGARRLAERAAPPPSPPPSEPSPQPPENGSGNALTMAGGAPRLLGGEHVSLTAPPHVGLGGGRLALLAEFRTAMDRYGTRQIGPLRSAFRVDLA